MPHQEVDTAGRRFTTVGEGGPLGPGRLFQNPSLSTLDRLIEASRDLPTTAGRRGADVAFKNFSTFLDLQDRRQAARQNQGLRRQAAEAQVEKQRLANEAAQQKLDRPTAGLTPDLIALSSQPREQFLAGMTQLRERGTRLKGDDLVALNRANLQQVAQTRLAETEARQQETAAGRSRTALNAEDITILEDQLGRPLTRSEKIQLRDPALRNVLLSQLSQEAAAEPGARETPEEAAPFTQAPEQTGAEGVADAATVRQVAAEIGSRNPKVIKAELQRRGLRVQ